MERTAPCCYREFCRNGIACTWSHTTDELDLFKRRGGAGYRRLKVKVCTRPACLDPYHKATCTYRHSDEGELCRACLSTDVGHEQGGVECQQRAERRGIISTKQLETLRKKNYIAPY